MNLAESPLYKRAEAMAIEDLHGLTDKHVKFLHFLLKEVLKFSTYDISVDFRNKEIVMRVYTSNYQQMYVKPKDPDFIGKIEKYMNIPQWSVRFAQKEENVSV
jgi:hypothetical protein